MWVRFKDLQTTNNVLCTRARINKGLTSERQRNEQSHNKISVEEPQLNSKIKIG